MSGMDGYPSDRPSGSHRRPSNSDDSSASSASDPQDLALDDDGWQDVEPETNEEQFVCLFNDATLSSVDALLKHSRESHNFDLALIRKELGLDFYGMIKLVNYIRSEVKSGNVSPTVPSKETFNDEKYLHPVLEDDALLFTLDEVVGADSAPSEGKAALSPKEAQSSIGRVAELEEELRRLQSQFTDYQATVKKVLNDRLDKQDDETAPESSAKNGDGSKSTPNPADESHYFTSYSYNEIHEVMLKDTVRTDAYRDFIYDNKNLFQGKTVLDVGCGTGILSMFCAKAGAKQVIAVDNSDIIDKARQNVFENGLEGVITCLKGKIEEVILPVGQVDIIISEWMGYCLLYEAMLDSVLWARDKYLSPTGLMVPSHTTLYLAPLADPDYISSHISFWHSVYGFTMTSMLSKIFDDVLTQHTDAKTLAASPSPFLHLDLYKTNTSDLTFAKPFSISLTQDVDALDGWAIWFDMFFLTSREDYLAPDSRALEWTKKGGRGVAFTTGPEGPETHWRQGVLLIDHGKRPAQPLKAGQSIKGRIGYKKPKENSRELDVEMEWDVEAAEDGKTRKQSWRL
ncbi:MAG: hypothetical protein M4579_000960 [Chaenotheca gracillima]|nr:MAG: hypothetical protein M4579_000960 [Chaenotheca gracillima]